MVEGDTEYTKLMISLDQIRSLEPKLKDSSDEEVSIIREKLYELAQLTFDSWVDENGSKIPVGLNDLDTNK